MDDLRNFEPNSHTFDCRRYIKIGDSICFDSTKACDTPQQVDHQLSTIPYVGRVVAVYEAFVVVKLKKITECVNRWNIKSVNGKDIGNTIGLFSRALKEVRAE